MKTKAIHLLAIAISPAWLMMTNAVAALRAKLGFAAAKRRPKLTREEADFLVSRFNVNSWNAGGEDMEAAKQDKAVPA